MSKDKNFIYNKIKKIPYLCKKLNIKKISNMTKIANPIYDVVFKYLLSDNKIAKLMLSTIIGKEVVTLQFRDTEKRTDLDKSIKYHRLDFSAEIKDKNNSEPEIRRKMDLEDDLIDEIRNKDLAIKRRDEKLEKKDKEHKKELVEKDEKLSEQEKIIKELQKQLNRRSD